jgi:arabinose-5-phosphate isomerase
MKSLAREFLVHAREALVVEAQCVADAANRLGPAFSNLCGAIVERTGQISGAGKVVTSGIGKSGFIARKMASTLASTGTPAFYLHPSEAMHGDFGIIQGNDILVAIAHGGETPEVIEVARFCRRRGIPVAAITGKLDSTLARASDFVIDGSIPREACPLNLAPTSSSLVAMALSDALAIAIMKERGFTAQDFAALHPAGSLGRRLSQVKDHMHDLDQLPTVGLETDFHAALEAVTKRNFGIVAVVEGNPIRLIGAISDGDIRRHLLGHGARALDSKVGEFMRRSPRVITADALAIDAVLVMEKHQITSLFVTAADDAGQLAGIVRMHDLLAAKIV